MLPSELVLVAIESWNNEERKVKDLVKFEIWLISFQSSLNMNNKIIQKNPTWMIREIILWVKDNIPNWKYPTINTYFQVKSFKKTKINKAPRQQELWLKTKKLKIKFTRIQNYICFQKKQFSSFYLSLILIQVYSWLKSTMLLNRKLNLSIISFSKHIEQDSFFIFHKCEKSTKYSQEMLK